MYNEENLRHKYTKCQDYKKVFGTAEGESVLYDLMTHSNFLKPTHIPGDPHGSDKNEGMRELFLYILYQIERDPSSILETIRVQRDQEAKDKGNIYANIN